MEWKSYIVIGNPFQASDFEEESVLDLLSVDNPPL